MTSTTIGKLGQYYRIVGEPGPVAVQTPAHVHDLRILGNINGAHITMAGFTVQTRRDMRTMYEVDKVRHLSDRHPGNLVVIQNIIF